MKRKWNKKKLFLLPVLALLAFALIGCTAAAKTGNGDGYRGSGNGGDRSANAANATNGSDACDTNSCDACDTNGSSENAQTGTGYRGSNGSGNGSENGQSNADDTCLTSGNGNGAGSGASNYVATESDKTLSLEGYGSEGALVDTDLSLADMLTYALQDEYLAHAEYEMILDTYGSVRPFSSIIEAEQTHIDTLLPLFETYGIEAPADTGADNTAAVGSLTEAYQAGVNAEINNIAMYETFLEQDLPSDVQTVFESLMSASENHLRAFQNRL